MSASRAAACLLLVLLAIQCVSAQWEDNNYQYRKAVSFSEPAGLARTKEHVRFDVSIPSGHKIASGIPALYCSGSKVPLDFFDKDVSGGFATTVQAVAELDFSAGEGKSCYLYYDPAYAGAASAAMSSGWNYVCDSHSRAGGASATPPCGQPDDFATIGRSDYYGQYNQLGVANIACGAVQHYFIHNIWCYYKATQASRTFALGSDDGSDLAVDGSQVINNKYCQGLTYRTGTANFNVGQFYGLRVLYDEWGGSHDLYLRYDSATGGIVGTGCYGYVGGPWLIATSILDETSRNNPPVLSSSSVIPNPGGWYDRFSYNLAFTEPDNDAVTCTFKVRKNPSSPWVTIGSASGTAACTLSQTPYTCEYIGSQAEWAADYDDGQGHTGTWGPFPGPALTGACCSNPLVMPYTTTYSGTPREAVVLFDENDWDANDYHCFDIDGQRIAALQSYPAQGIKFNDSSIMGSGSHTMTITMSASQACDASSLNRWNVTNVDIRLTYYGL